MDSLDEIRDLVARRFVSKQSWAVDTQLDGLRVASIEMTTEAMPHLYEPVFGLIVQGEKRIVLGGKTFHARAGEYIVGSLEVPVTSQVVSATREEPFLAVSMKLKPALIASLLLEEKAGRQRESFPGMGVSAAHGDLLGAVARLLRVLERPRDAAVLSPLAEREILWYLLCEEQGAVIRQVGLTDGRLLRISESIRWIRTHFAESIRIDDLAQMAGMSLSSFHRQFRAATAMSPLQYQKQVRLQEARSRLMVQPEEVATVGFAVGYDSPSQFSREYRRLFGAPPGKDAVRLRQGHIRERMVLID